MLVFEGNMKNLGHLERARKIQARICVSDEVPAVEPESVIKVYGHGEQCNCILALPSTNSVATASYDRTIRIFALSETCSSIHVLEYRNDMVCDLALV